jgi:hypothetical protein
MNKKIDKKKACPKKDWPLLTYEKHLFKYLQPDYYTITLQRYLCLKKFSASNDAK